MTKQQRSTRVLKHPDGSFTVEVLLEAKVLVPSDGPFALPKTIKRWASDPGFAVQTGFVGQHTHERAAVERAYVLAHVEPEDAMYAEIVQFHLRDEDKTPSELVN